MATVGSVNIGSASDVINALDGVVQTNITQIIITFVLAMVVLLLLKVVAEAAAGFIQLRLDQHLAIGSLVEVFGKKGFIKSVTLFTITIETEYEFIRIPTKQWRLSKFLILKGCGPLPDRRKNDKKKKVVVDYPIIESNPIHVPNIKKDSDKECVCKFTNQV